MFERFTKEARAAVLAAVTSAEAAGDGWVGREHLLVGLAAVGEPTLAEAGLTRDGLQAALDAIDAQDPDADALAAIGIDLDAIREAVQRDLGPDAWRAGTPRRRREGGLLGRLLPSHRPFTSGARKTLELALREALREGSKELTTLHVLRGLLRDPGPAATALIETKLPLAELRHRASGEAPAA